VLNIGDQYLYGPAIMVNSVTTQGAMSRTVYLPGHNSWYDFWTGNREASGRSIEATAPIQTVPLYTPQGRSFLWGPLIQFVGKTCRSN
jgi:alpha-D-xyloside xylohydrolase